MKSNSNINNNAYNSIPPISSRDSQRVKISPKLSLKTGVLPVKIAKN